jgi:YtcA family
MFISGPHSPTLNLFGSYFPAWMLCAVVGILAAVIIRQVLVAAGIGEYVISPLLTYAGLAVSATFLVWLVWFGHRAMSALRKALRAPWSASLRWWACS